ncbi:MAG: hypothetical protein EPO32_06980 [Anaerolineae bacterium]|nr:MAG: hypothetical protein EPO32_06980 [Anaerolineae bacterium]
MLKRASFILLAALLALLALTSAIPAQAGKFLADRPIVVLAEYVIKPGTVFPGQDFDLYLRFKNLGKEEALNLVATIGSAEVFPRRAGGVYSLGSLAVNKSVELEQVMTASGALTGDTPISMPVTVSYEDAAANAYTETFTVVVTMGIRPTATYPYTGPALPTSTPTPQARPQLVIVGYSIQPDELAPGTRFDLILEVQNVGAANAIDVLMVAGGATVTTPSEEPGGQPTVSGGDFSKFSPLGVSNIQPMGAVPAGQTVSATQPLIVNVSTEPGAYSFPISFVYVDRDNQTRVDNQVITLLVYSPPNVEISFYQPAGPFFAGQPNFLPLQIVNLGRKTIILGNLTISTEGGFLENASILIGPLDPGGYFTLDATLYPDFEGPLTLTINVDYTDDFNDPQTITRTMDIVVEPAPTYYGPPEGYPTDGGYTPPASDESFLQKVWRFFLGLLGLDSAPATDDGTSSPYGSGDYYPEDGGGGGGGGGGVPAPGKSP